MKILHALFCIALLAAVGDTGVRAQTATQNWPTRPIRLIVPTGPGLGTDIMARLLADGVSRPLGQQIYVENVPGASGITGAQQAARAAPDGYTLFFANASTFTSNMFLLKSIPYDPARDFTAVAMVSNQGPVVVSVYPELPVKTLAELIAYGKAQPGKLSYAVDATSGLGVVIGRLLNKRGGIGMVEVPYRTTAQMMQDTSVGTTQVMISSFAAVEGFARAGKVRRAELGATLPRPRRPAHHRGNAAGLRARRLAGRGRSRRDARRHRDAVEPAHRPVPAQSRHPAAARRSGPCNQRHRHGRDNRGVHPPAAGVMAFPCPGARSAAGMRANVGIRCCAIAHR
jgi:tripartite-type tricarboxylate transporter receptor subunit TctC